MLSYVQNPSTQEGRYRRKNHELKVILVYIAGSRPSWATGNPGTNKKNKQLAIKTPKQDFIRAYADGAEQDTFSRLAWKTCEEHCIYRAEKAGLCTCNLLTGKIDLLHRHIGLVCADTHPWERCSSGTGVGYLKWMQHWWGRIWSSHSSTPVKYSKYWPWQLWQWSKVFPGLLVLHQYLGYPLM